jgi:hypothetical protein
MHAISAAGFGVAGKMFSPTRFKQMERDIVGMEPF